MILVDAHQHFWDPAVAEYPWLAHDGLAPVRRRFYPDDLEPVVREHGVGGTVLVQALGSPAETRRLLDLAEATPFVLGVVGWIDLTDPDAAGALARLAGGTLVGIRHQVHDEPDPAWLLRPDVQRGIAAVGEAGLAYDLLVRPAELPAAIETARRQPGMRFVVDHVAKPPLRGGDAGEWARGLEQLAALQNVSCKLSGLVVEADWGAWRAEELVPYYRRALEWFGPERCLFGSDWPLCLVSADYAAVLELVRAALAELGETERAAVLGGNAMRLYRL
ncbi:MAG: L-fuconolactonase [Gaiellaceae bacterium]|nr:L-fuconolactonase [Gaiellaceae bacterium]